MIDDVGRDGRLETVQGNPVDVAPLHLALRVQHRLLPQQRLFERRNQPAKPINHNFYPILTSHFVVVLVVVLDPVHVLVALLAALHVARERLLLRVVEREQLVTPTTGEN
jgi:hypothetical protein